MAQDTYRKTEKNKPLPPPTSNGYPDTPKTAGVQTRGNGAATKGKTARGPLG